MKAMNNDSNIFMEYACSQFGNPRGLIGRLAGNIMANRSSNKERNLWTLELLEIEKEDWVLEIGFGPGFALQHVAKLASKGFVVGVDRSYEMLKMATKRNEAAIHDKLIELRKGSLEDLPIQKGVQFHKIYSVNTWMFWSDTDRYLENLYNLLHENGRIAITHQPRFKGATEQDAISCGKEIATALKLAGFRDARVEVKQMEPVAAISVIGEK
jgi:SAM-dependent methyltransferase